MITLAIDIGLTGAVACLNGDQTRLCDLPVMESKAGSRIAARELLDILLMWIPPGEPSLFVIEDVRPRPMGNGGSAGNTMYSQGSLMRSRGIVEAVVDMVPRAEVLWVQPQTWKRHYSLIGKDKEAGRLTALRLFPHMASVLARKQDHNRADTLLMALYGRVDDSPQGAF